MTNLHLTTTRPAAIRVRPVAIVLALTIAAGAGGVALTAEDAAVPAQPGWPDSGPIFNDPPVAKGAHGRLPKVFDEVKVCKGARCDR